jgi:hypothetical protein
VASPRSLPVTSRRLGRLVVLGDRQRRVVGAGAPLRGRRAHVELQGPALGEVVGAQVCLRVGPAVEPQALDVDVARAVARRLDDEVAAALEVDRRLLETGRATRRSGVRDLVPRPPLAHAHVAGLEHLVDRPFVRAREGGRLGRREELVELGGELVAPAVEVGQAPAVLGRVEGEAPAVRLGVVVMAAPRARVVVARRRRPLAARRLALEEPDRRVEEIDVVMSAAEEVVVLCLVALALRGIGGLVGQLLGHVGDAEVVDVRLQRPRQALGRAVGGVAEEGRPDQALAPDVRVEGVAGRRDRGIAQGGVVGVLSAEALDALEVGVGEGDVRAHARHEVRVAGRGPARDPAAVAVLLHESVDELARHLRRQQRVGRPGRPVGVPEAVVDVDLAVDDGGAGLRRVARRGVGGGLDGVLVDRL